MRMIYLKVSLVSLRKVIPIWIRQYRLGTMIGMVVIDAHSTVKLLNKHNTY